MKFIAIIALLAFTATAGLAQNRANIQGKVVDSASNEVLELATVAVVNPADSSLVSYTVTNKAGEFTLHNLPSGKPLKVVISFVTYNNYRKILNLEKAANVDLGTLKLSSKVNSLNEVKISGEVIPVVMRKDTIEFNAEAFKTPPNSVVEDLLKRLPGLEVDMNGNITANGKKVKLKVNGKQFFSNDPRIASKNLDADMVAKVQVYDDREDDPDHLIPDAEVNKIINLKLKSEIKKSVGGKLHGGYGSRNRFDAGLLYNMFRDTLQISLIGISNNLNRTGFSNGDLNSLGGFNRGGSDALNWGGLNTGGRSGGMETVASGGLNINTDYGKKLKINLLYYYSHSSNIYNVSSTTQQALSKDTTLNSISILGYTGNTDKHNISSLVEWNPDTTIKIRYQPGINFNPAINTQQSGSNISNNFVPQLYNSIYSSRDISDNFQFQQTLNFYRKKRKDGGSINITHDLNINPGTSQSYSLNNITSFTTTVPSDTLDRLGDNNNKSASGSLNISYRYPLNKKFTAGISLNNYFRQSHGRLFTYDLDPQTSQYTIYIDSLSRDLTRREFSETARPELTYNINKQTRLIANVGIQLMQTYSRFRRNTADINRQDVFLLPSLSFSSAKVSFSYSVRVSQPSINDLIPYTTVYNQLSSSSGNPLLKPTRSHTFNMSYYTNVPEKMLNINAYSYFYFDENSIFSTRIQSGNGKSFSMPVNRTGSYSVSFGGSVGKGFKKFNNWQIRLNTNMYGSFRHNFFQINGLEGLQNTVSSSITQQIFANWNNKFEINPSYSIRPSITYYQLIKYNSVKYATQSLYAPVVLKWVKHMTFEANYSYNYNPLVTNGQKKGTNILNLSVARQIQFRDRGEIKISCFDLLDQSSDFYHYISGNTISDQQSQILKRYFLLTYAYRFTSTTTKK